MKIKLCLLVFCLWILPASSNSQVEGIARLKISEIVFEGNNNISSRELFDLMESKRGREFANYRLDDDLNTIISYYNQNGYLSAGIENVKRKPNMEQKKIAVTIRIFEGTQTILRNTTIIGNTVFNDDELLSVDNIKTNRPLNKSRLNRFRETVFDKYASKGYIYAVVDTLITYSADMDSAEVLFNVLEGELVKVASIQIEGNDTIDKSTIRKFVTLKEGEVFNPKELLKTQSRIYQLGVFRNVRIDLLGIDEKASDVDLIIKVKEDQMKWVGFGFGVGSAEGIRTSIEWGNKNIFNKAQTLSFKTRVTYQPFEKISERIFTNLNSLSLRQPWFLKSSLEALWLVSQENIIFTDYQQQEIAVQSIFYPPFNPSRRVSVDFNLKSTYIFDIADIDSVAQDVIDNEGRRTTTSIRLSYVIDKRDDKVYPTEKYFFSAQSTLAGGPLFGSVNFVRMNIEYTQYHRFKKFLPFIVFVPHAKLGAARQFGTSTSVPPGEQFILGGANSLRGHREESINPVGDPFARQGNIMIQFNLEARVPIWGKLEGACFIDAGNLYKNLRRVGFFDLKSSTGFGLRYRSPIGAIRVDGSLRLDKTSKGFVHFGVGYPF